MIIYVPYYDEVKQVKAIDNTQAKFRNDHGTMNIFYRGSIYSGKDIFDTEEGAWAWWNKEDITADNSRIEFDGTLFYIPLF